MRREFDRLVPPFRGSVHARDQAGAVNPAEVAVHECVSRLGLVVCAIGQAEMPLRGIIYTDSEHSVIDVSVDVAPFKGGVLHA